MAEIDFEYQGYYDFVDDFIGKEANTVFFHNEPNRDVEQIQEESWSSDAQPFAYITDHTKTMDGKTAVYELRNWTTDEVIGEVRVEDDDDYYDGTSITYNNSSYNYDNNNSGVSSFTNGEDTIYCFDSKDSRWYFMFVGRVASKIYEMI